MQAICGCAMGASGAARDLHATGQACYPLRGGVR